MQLIVKNLFKVLSMTTIVLGFKQMSIKITCPECKKVIEKLGQHYRTLANVGDGHYEGVYDCTNHFIFTEKGKEYLRELDYKRDHQTETCSNCGESVYSTLDHWRDDGMGCSSWFVCSKQNRIRQDW